MVHTGGVLLSDRCRVERGEDGVQEAVYGKEGGERGGGRERRGATQLALGVDDEDAGVGYANL